MLNQAATLIELEGFLIPEDHVCELVSLVLMGPVKSILVVIWRKNNGRLSLSTNETKGAADGAQMARRNVEMKMVHNFTGCCFIVVLSKPFDSM